MKKLLSFTLAAVLLMQIGIPANAITAAARGPKKTFCTSYQTTITTVTLGPAAVYGVIVGTGAPSEFLAIFDSGSATGLSVSSSAFQVTPHIFENNVGTLALSSTTVIPFDPPIEILNGLMIGNSAATGSACIVYEQGRGLSGQ